MTKDERNGYANLIVLCAEHHQLVDTQPEAWTVEKLLAMKAAHERLVDEHLGRVNSSLSTTDTSYRHSDESPLQWFIGTGELLPTIRSMTDPFRVGVHPAIPLSADADPRLSRDLPTYVPRDIDAELDAALLARGGEGGLVLLVGHAASGKTRCLYEATRRVLPDWRLVAPSTAQDLTDLVTSGVPLGRSVVWLDDIERYLGPGQLSHRVVRRMLADPAQPVILVGTIWPEHYDRLRAHTSDQDVQDLQRDAREILALARRFDVPSHFSPQESEHAADIAETDPRIDEALRHPETGSMTAVLACAPELIRRLTQPSNPVGAAVITAAIHARLCGHPSVVPVPLLRNLAQVYLNGAQRARAGADWFDTAVDWACMPVRGVIAPLAPYAREVGELHGYQVSDVLVQYADTDSATFRDIPNATWEHLVTEANTAACLMIGMFASFRGLPQFAQRALERAAETGDTNAMTALGFLFWNQADLDRARVWTQRAVDHGDIDAMATLAAVLDRQGDPASSRIWLQRGADAGHTLAMVGLGRCLEDDGDAEAARGWYWRAADAGDAVAMGYLATMLDHGDGERDRIVERLRQAAHTGDPTAMMSLGDLLRDSGDATGAVEWLRRAAECGHVEGMAHLGDLMRAEGNVADAAVWLGHAAAAGFVPAMAALGAVLWQRGDVLAARSWLERGAAAGDVDAMGGLGALLDEQGDAEGARRWLSRAVENGGNPETMIRFGIFLCEHGDAEAAKRWYQKAVDSGASDGAMLLGALFAEEGNFEAARAHYERAADSGSVTAMTCLAALLRRAGDMDAAHDWSCRAAEGGDVGAMKTLGAYAQQDGDSASACRWFGMAAGTGDTEAMVFLAALLMELGDSDVAQYWLERAANAGNVMAGTGLGLRFLDQGELVSAAKWLLKSAKAADVTAMTPLADALSRLGNNGGAKRWLLRAAELGDTEAAAATGPVASTGGDPPTGRGGIQWTPLEHTCGCVTDWGWRSDSADPRMFISWCTRMIETDCPSHDRTLDVARVRRGPELVAFRDHTTGATFYTRQASGQDIALGRRLGQELRHITRQLVRKDPDVILADIPVAYRHWLQDNGYDPAAAWIDQRFSDIVLNRGDSIFPDILAHIGNPSAGSW
jgi:TPR repeat protein